MKERQRPQRLGELVAPALEPVDVLRGHPELRLLGVARPQRLGQVGAQVEQLVLDGAQHRGHLRRQLAEGQRHAEGGVGLVHVPVRLDPRIGLPGHRHVGQPGLAAIPGSGVDTGEADHGNTLRTSLPPIGMGLCHSSPVPSASDAPVVLAGCCVLLLAGCGRIPSPPTEPTLGRRPGARGSASTPRPARRPSRWTCRRPRAWPPAARSDYVLEMTEGAVTITLDQAKAPCTVNSFVSLARQGYFDKTRCHRLADSGIFVLQCGDPTGTGSGRTGLPVRQRDRRHRVLRPRGGGHGQRRARTPTARSSSWSGTTRRAWTRRRTTRSSAPWTRPAGTWWPRWPPRARTAATPTAPDGPTTRARSSARLRPDGDVVTPGSPLLWWDGFPVAFVLTCAIELPAYVLAFATLGWCRFAAEPAPAADHPEALALALAVNLITHPLLWAVSLSSTGPASCWSPSSAVARGRGPADLPGRAVAAGARTAGPAGWAGR